MGLPRWIERYIETFFGENDIPQDSSDVDHDDTVGGTAGNPHTDSAAVSDVSSIQSSSDVDHDSTNGGTDSDAHHSKTTSGEIDHDATTGGTAGNPHADSAAVSDVSSIQSSSDVDHDDTTGGTAGNPHADSIGNGDAVTDLGVGTLSDGEVAKNVGGSLVGGSGGGIGQVATYDDLPVDGSATTPDVRFVSNEGDYVGLVRETPALWRSLSDYTVVANAIPDRALVHDYNVNNLSGSDGTTQSSLDDDVGGATLTAPSGQEPTLRTNSNGNRYLEFEKGNDGEMSTTYTNISEPYEIFLVGEPRTRNTDSGNRALYDGATAREQLLAQNSGGNDELFILQQGGSGVIITPETTDLHLYRALFRSSGSNDLIERDGGETKTGDAGSSDSTGFTLANSPSSTEGYSDINVYRVLIYSDELTSSELTKLESEIESTYDITIV